MRWNAEFLTCSGRASFTVLYSGCGESLDLTFPTAAVPVRSRRCGMSAFVSHRHTTIFKDQELKFLISLRTG